jgi:hypothetical protein
VSVVIWVWQRHSLTTGLTLALFAAGIGYSLLWIIFALLSWWRAKSNLAGVPQGLAARIDRWGIGLQALAVPWSDISAIQVRRSRFGGSPTLRVTTLSGVAAQLPILYLDVMPGTIDASIRAFSQGTHSLDTSRLGN